LANPSVLQVNLPDNARNQASRQLPNCRAGHAKALRDEGKSLRKIADALASEFNLKKLDAMSVKRIHDRA
jgi:hypothetical protein